MRHPINRTPVFRNKPRGSARERLVTQGSQGANFRILGIPVGTLIKDSLSTTSRLVLVSSVWATSYKGVYGMALVP